jgi:predicted amidophosphoribosyltransferase
MTKKGDAILGLIIGIITAIIIGLLAAAILDYLLRGEQHCPNCNHRIKKTAEICENCGISLRG